MRIGRPTDPDCADDPGACTPATENEPMPYELSVGTLLCFIVALGAGVLGWILGRHH